MIAYKIGRRTWSPVVFHSYCHSYAPVTYTKGEDTEREEGNGPLATFETIDDAIRFANSDNDRWDSVVLWECEITISTDTDMWYSFAYGRINRYKNYYQPELPYGTVLADIVRPIRRIPVSVTRDDRSFFSSDHLVVSESEDVLHTP